MPIQLWPRIVTTQGQSILTLSGLTPEQAYRVSILPFREKDSHLEYKSHADSTGQITWTQSIPWMGEAIMDLFAGDALTPVTELRFYAAAPEIADCRPLKCDFHIHTTYSDGRSTPAEMVIRGRELGLDALAITDHNQYAASLEAVEFVQKSGLGITPFAGEEVTSRTWHLLSLGASGPIGYQASQAGYDGLRKTIDMVHQKGGKAFLAHPYWTSGRRINQPAEEYERLLAEGGLDGVELFGDVLWEENLRSMVRYSELNPQAKLPVLGNSDTHAREHTFGGYWTVAFSRSLSQADILNAVLSRSAVACMRMPMEPAGQTLRSRLLSFGPFELMDLTLFLEEHYFPQHDLICQKEAELARRFWAGEAVEAAAFLQIQNDLEAYYCRFWGKG